MHPPHAPTQLGACFFMRHSVAVAPSKLEGATSPKRLTQRPDQKSGRFSLGATVRRRMIAAWLNKPGMVPGQETKNA